jgi:SAM-dependent methyltransferase
MVSRLTWDLESLVRAVTANRCSSATVDHLIRTAMRRTITPQGQVRLRQRLRRLTRSAWFGTLRRTRPLSDRYGRDRGTPLDRYYITHFLARHRADIRGCVLEIKDSQYTRRFGSCLDRVEVLDIEPRNAAATIIADLARADNVAPNQFDCFVLTQTLQYIYDVRAAVEHAHRILRPGGVLLATLPAVGRIENDAAFQGGKRGLDEDYWRFSLASARRLFADAFGLDLVEVTSFGNVLVGAACLFAVAQEELSRRELDDLDPYFPVIIAVRAVKRRST